MVFRERHNLQVAYSAESSISKNDRRFHPGRLLNNLISNQRIRNPVPMYIPCPVLAGVRLFSYLCNGMNIKDIFNLKFKDINKDSIQYDRS